MKNTLQPHACGVDAEDSNLLNEVGIVIKLGRLQQALHPCGGRSPLKLKSTQNI